MILPLQERFRSRVREVLSERLGIGADETIAIPIETPPNRSLGDLGTPVAFELARRLRKAPRAIAQEIAAGSAAIDGIARVDAAPNGYLNVFLDRRDVFCSHRLGLANETPRAPVHTEKTIVEHTAINPNKAAHIGHLRNSALGDTLVRVLLFRGNAGRGAELHRRHRRPGGRRRRRVPGARRPGPRGQSSARRHDPIRLLLLGSLRAGDRVVWRRQRAPEESAPRRCTTSSTATDPAADIGAFIADRIVRCHLKTMARLNIDYQLLTWEGDILRLKFWARAFEVLKQTGAVFLQTDGRLAGCWVMTIDERSPPTLGRIRRADEDAAEDREKVIVRSNGTVTYVGKDMAYQFWKSGLLGHDFLYRRFATRLNGEELWATTSDRASADAPHPPFGAAAATYNVIDVRQSYLQKLLKQALIAVGHPAEAERLTHFSYEMVALSHATAQELGLRAATGFRRRQAAVRRGLGAKRPGREGRRSDRSRDREGAGRGRAAQRRVAGRRAPADRRARSASPPCATS